MTTPKTPSNFVMTGPLTIEAADAGEKQIPRFKMVAYTGGPMRVEGFPHPVVVDLEGLSIDRQDIPIRLDHNPRQGVGHTQRVAIENGQVIAEGLISRDNSWARDVAKSGTNGFPWQASIGAEVIDAEFIPNGQTVTVNGRTMSGPIHVIRKAVLKEISFVDSGADGNTSASVAAMENTTMNEPVTPNDATNGSGTPTPTPAATPEPVVNAAAPGTAVDNEIVARRQQLAAEVRRIDAIRNVCGGKHPDIEAKAIEEGWDASTTELHILRASRQSAPAISVPKRPDTPQVFEAVALMAAGTKTDRLEAHYAPPILEAADKLRGIGIQEFCELACGQNLPRFRRAASDWLQAAFSTVSLPGILSNVANKLLLEGYNYVEDSWRRIVKIASVNDFKQHTRYRMTGNMQFQKVGPDGELKHGSIGEQSFTQQADTLGIMFALTRQMIINDDLGAFTEIPRQIGMGAADAIADAVWTLLLSNPTQSDGQAFFSAAHKNYAEGADTALSVDGLTAAELLFANQTKPNGKPLGMPASILLVPTALKTVAQVLMTTAQVNETTTANKPKPNANPHVGKFEVVSSAYLGNASYTGYSSKAWYLFADPNRLPALEVAFLNGVDTPTVEQTDADFNTLGIQFRGFIDFGVKEQDYRGAVKMKGEQ